MKRVLLWLNAPLAWGQFLSVSLLNIALGVLLQVVALPFDRCRRTALWVNHVIWGHGLFALQPFWTMDRRGLETVGDGPYVIVANHSSILDIPSCMGLPVPSRVVAKRSLLRVPVMGWYMQFSGMIALDRGGTPEQTAASMKAFKDTIDAGLSVLIFPEGTRSEDGELGAFNRGAFRLSKDLGVPVLPVVVEGTRFIMAKGSLLPQTVTQDIKMQVLEPFDPEQYSTARKMSNRVRERMVAGLAELRA